MKIEIDMPQAQIDLITENLKREKWLGSLEEFIRLAIRREQEDLLRSGVFKPRR